MKIAILEKTNFNKKQIERLQAFGTVDCFESLTQDQANELAPQYDVVIVNWLDPTPFLLKMKKGSLVALLSTGYGWISNLEEASKLGIYVANIPGYSTEAVAEHLLGLLLGVSKNIFATLNSNNNGLIGFELKGKTIGIIGLGNIGGRFAQISSFLGANIITYNRKRKNVSDIEDVSLTELMKRSDIICITCAVNNESKNLINKENCSFLKKNVIIIGSTWDIVEERVIIDGIKDGTISYIAFDAAVEGNSIVSTEITNELKGRVFLTPHIAYNTYESEERQLNICIDNIDSFIKGKPQNIVNT